MPGTIWPGKCKISIQSIIIDTDEPIRLCCVVQSDGCRNEYGEITYSERAARFRDPIVDGIRTRHRTARSQSAHHHGNDADNDQYSASVLCGELRFIFDVNVLFHVPGTCWLSPRYRLRFSETTNVGFIPRLGWRLPSRK